MVLNYSFILICIIYLFFYNFIASTNVFGFFSSQFASLSIQDVSPINKALAGGSVALPSGLDGIIVNPAQLAYSQQTSGYFSFFNGFYKDQYLQTSASHRFSKKKVPISFGFEVSIPESFQELNAHGDTINSYSYYEILFGVTSGYAFKNSKQNIYLGGSIKYNYANILYEKAHLVLFDLGFILPFNIKALYFKKSVNKENFFLGVSLQNFGSTAKINNNTIYPPSSVQLGIAYIIFQNKIHHILITLSSQTFIPYLRINILNRLGAGVEYSWLKFLKLRFGFMHNFNNWELKTGVGVHYTFRTLYLIQLDFNLDFIQNLGLAQHVSLKFSVLYSSTKNKILKQVQYQKERETSFNENIITLLKKGIITYKLKYNKFPATLDELKPWLLEQHQLKEIPSVVKKKIEYDPYTGKIALKVHTSLLSYSDKILMKDGSEYYGHIEFFKEKTITLRNENGLSVYDKSKIKYIRNIKLESIDQEQLKIMESYLIKYKNEHSKYPDNELIFLLYLKQYNIIKFPELNYGTLEYDSTQAKMLIICNINNCSE